MVSHHFKAVHMCFVIYCCHVRFLLRCKPVLVTYHPDQRQSTDEKLFFFMYIRVSPHMYRNIYTHTVKGPLYKLFTKQIEPSLFGVWKDYFTEVAFPWISVKVFFCSFCISFYRCKIIWRSVRVNSFLILTKWMSYFNSVSMYCVRTQTCWLW
jgi:hypothetical protein